MVLSKQGWNGETKGGKSAQGGRPALLKQTRGCVPSLERTVGVWGGERKCHWAGGSWTSEGGGLGHYRADSSCTKGYQRVKEGAQNEIKP